MGFSPWFVKLVFKEHQDFFSKVVHLKGVVLTSMSLSQLLLLSVILWRRGSGETAGKRGGTLSWHLQFPTVREGSGNARGHGTSTASRWVIDFHTSGDKVNKISVALWHWWHWPNMHALQGGSLKAESNGPRSPALQKEREEWSGISGHGFAVPSFWEQGDFCVFQMRLVWSRVPCFPKLCNILIKTFSFPTSLCFMPVFGGGHLNPIP